MGVREADAFTRDAIDVGSLDACRAVAGDITISQVVGVNEDDIWMGCARGDCSEEAGEECEDKKRTVPNVHRS